MTRIVSVSSAAVILLSMSERPLYAEHWNAVNCFTLKTNTEQSINFTVAPVTVYYCNGTLLRASVYLP